MRFKQQACSIFLVCGLSAFILLATALLLLDLYLDTIVQQRIHQYLQLLPESEIAKIIFKSPETYSYFSLWLFSVENPNKKNATVKTRLSLKGPYVYRKYVLFEDVNWSSDDMSTVTFMERTRFVFDKEKSVGDPKKDRIVGARLSDLVISEKMRSWQPNVFIREIAKLFLKLYAATSVKEYVWGYEDKLVKILRKFHPRFAAQSDLVGLLAGKNDSLDGPFTISTGVGDISKLGNILRYKNKSSLDFWHGAQANVLTGSAIPLMAPNMKFGQTLNLYGSTFCRSVRTRITKRRSGRDLPKLELFQLDTEDELFCSAEDCPSNADYRAVNSTRGKLPTGLLDMSRCMAPTGQSFPFYVSRLFFNKAALNVTSKVEFVSKLEPDGDFRFQVDPRTGVLLEAKKNFQINILINGYNDLGNFEIYPDDVYFPIAYIQEKGAASEENKRLLYDAAYATPENIKIAILTLMCLSFAGAVSILAVGIARMVKLDFSFRHLSEDFRKQTSSTKGLDVESTSDDSGCSIRF